MRDESDFPVESPDAGGDASTLTVARETRSHPATKQNGRAKKHSGSPDDPAHSANYRSDIIQETPLNIFLLPVTERIQLHDPETEPDPDSLIMREFAVALLGITNIDLSEHVAADLVSPVTRLAFPLPHAEIEYIELFKAEHIYILRRNIDPLATFDIITIDEVAKILDRSIKTIRRWSESGKILPVKTVPFGNRGNTLFFDKDDILKYLEKLEAAPEHRGRPRSHPPEVLSIQAAQRHLSRATRGFS